jgi:hypothetical protein
MGMSQVNNLLHLVLKVAKATNLSLYEVEQFTMEQIKEILETIQQVEYEQNMIQIALIDYQHFLNTSTKFDTKHQSEAQKCIRNATKIRNQLTGYKKPKNQNLSIFGNYRIKED